MPDGWHRHDLVRVDPTAWDRHLRARADLHGVPHLADWARARRPLIVRRAHPGEDGALLALGLPLPPADGKRRIGVALPPGAVEPCPSPALADVIEVAPPAWRPSIEAFVTLGADHGIVPRPFGSLLWQAVTGLAYLTPGSDLDLLWPLDGAPPVPLLDAIAAVAATAPMRLDGELILADGAGIQWRELYDAPDDGAVLCKHRDRLEMRPVTSLRETAAA